MDYVERLGPVSASRPCSLSSTIPYHLPRIHRFPACHTHRAKPYAKLTRCTVIRHWLELDGSLSPSSSSFRLVKPDSSSDDPVVDAYNCRRLPPRPPIPRYPSHGLARFSPQRLRRPRLLSSPIGTPCTGAHTTTDGFELRTSPRSASMSRQSHCL
jgi:hypothetical protein